MKRNDLAYDSNEEDVKELQRMINDMDSFINEAETRVNEAKDLLDNITCVSNLDQVEECLSLLKDLSNDLY